MWHACLPVRAAQGSRRAPIRCSGDTPPILGIALGCARRAASYMAASFVSLVFRKRGCREPSIASVICKKITGAFALALFEVKTMPATFERRIAALEQAALRAEGAHFALHDLVARTLARLPPPEAQSLIAALAAHADELDDDLGAERRAGYRDELASIAEEVEHVRGDAQGLLARLARAVGSAGGGR